MTVYVASVTSLDPVGVTAQTILSAQYGRELAPARDYDASSIAANCQVVREIERDWIRYFATNIDRATMPASAFAFEAWYRESALGLAQRQAPLRQYMAEQSSAQELAAFICLQARGLAAFADVLALAQIGLQGTAKVAMAWHYWDEMGDGDATCVRRTQLCEVADKVWSDIAGGAYAQLMDRMNPEALAVANVLIFFALRRRYGVRLLGALAMGEDWRAQWTRPLIEAMRRLNFPQSLVEPFEVRIDTDTDNRMALMRDVVMPLLRERPLLIDEVATGARIKQHVTNRYITRLLSAFESARAA